MVLRFEILVILVGIESGRLDRTYLGSGVISKLVGPWLVYKDVGDGIKSGLLYRT